MRKVILISLSFLLLLSACAREGHVEVDNSLINHHPSPRPTAAAIPTPQLTTIPLKLSALKLHLRTPRPPRTPRPLQNGFKGTPAPTPAPVSRAPQGSVQDRIVAAWPGDDRAVLRVIKCESGYDPRQKTGSHWGLLQIGVKTHADRIRRLGYTAEQMLEVEPNLAVGWDLYREQGWRPWTCKP